MAKKSSQFATKIGLIAATVGSAVGLGNIWRFPAEVQANGGAAFLLVYVLCVLILGIPVMLAEFALGRAGRSDAVGAFKNLGASRPWWLVGGLAILASYLILSFYMVVAGWTIEYLWQSITGGLFDHSVVPAGENNFAYKMELFIARPVAPLVNTFIMIVINLIVLLGGVQKGIERMSNVMMPLLFLILLIFLGESLTLPGAAKGVEFFLNPDFSKITPGVVLNALGQAFFSLSLGMGILITYSSYFPKNTNLPRTALTVAVLDMIVAIMMGLIIFPAVTSFGLQGDDMRGAALVFITLPEVFEQMHFTRLWAILFFLLLSVAALTSTISIAEVSVAFIRDRFRIARWNACLVVLLPLFVFSALCSLSMGPLESVRIAGFNIFDFLDNVATNIMLPVGSIFLCIYVGWFAPKNMLHNQLTNNCTIRSMLYAPVLAIIRYVAPLLIALVLFSYFF
ncbi:MAG: sodium-dependent transporter [Firmicutes bacterium]|nr:sodium-dependent transporter [Bacillota bacterium]MCM1401790.1 sodium-dependent transporter [Bacteroides sp.]MCM1477673.1 sodium-dependent transporter [Bacteroides sp.]